MKKLVIVGGLQYGGKSGFCRDIEEKTKGKYRRFTLDDSYTFLNTKGRGTALKLIEKTNPELHAKIVEAGWKNAVWGDAERFTMYARSRIEAGKRHDLDMMMNFYSMVYTTNLMIEAGDEVIPILDGVFINKVSRDLTYQTLRNLLKDHINLDDAKKVLVYLDMGLETSLLRYNLSGRPTSQVMECTKDTIRTTHGIQELPEQDELPNLEVMILKTQEDIAATQERLVKEVQLFST